MAMAVVLLIVSLLAAPAVYAVNHVVGDNSGWTQNVNYDNWAKGKTFAVGDNLVFNYESTHSVDQINQADYGTCTSSNALQTYTGGQTTIALTQAGPWYFLCPTFGHCAGGMKLSVTVAASGTTPSAPPTTTTPPSGSPSTPGTPATPKTASPPPSNGATGGFGSMNQLLLGICLVLAPVLAIMC